MFREIKDFRLDVQNSVLKNILSNTWVKLKVIFNYIKQIMKGIGICAKLLTNRINRSASRPMTGTHMGQQLTMVFSVYYGYHQGKRIILGLLGMFCKKKMGTTS